MNRNSNPPKPINKEFKGGFSLGLPGKNEKNDKVAFVGSRDEIHVKNGLKNNFKGVFVEPNRTDERIVQRLLWSGLNEPTNNYFKGGGGLPELMQTNSTHDLYL